MKQIFILAIATIFSTACATKTANTTTTTPKAQVTVIMPTANVPQTKLDTLQVGNILEGETIETHFFLKNNDTKPLIIASTVTGCGCTSLKYNTAPIMPGDSTLFTIVFDSKDRFGTQLKDIEIISAEYQKAKIIMLGTVVDNN